MDAEPRDAVALARELVPRLRRWTAANWSHPAEPPPSTGPAEPTGAGARAASGQPPSPRSRARAGEPAGPHSRADVVAGVVQRLADVAADAEGRSRRPVPRPAGVNLADQLAVMIDDIGRTGDPAALRTAGAELTALRRALGFR
jgi:hypothetical protein